MKRSCLLLLGVAVLISHVAALANPAGGTGTCPMRFAVIGDRTGGHDPGIHGRIIAEIERLRPDFVVGVGDMIEGYGADTVAVKQEWAEYKRLLKPLTMPVRLIPGNHDIWDDASEVLYKRLVGEPYYSFNVGDVHFLVLDTSRWDSSSTFPAAQLEWARGDLAANANAAYTFAFMHKPYWIETVAEGMPGPIHDLFVQYGVDAVFTGHYHVYFSGEFDGIVYTSVGSSGGGCEPGLTGLKYHFMWVTLDDRGISIAPIKMGAVLPWDEVSAGLFRYAERVEEKGLDVERLRVGRATVTPEARIEVTVANFDTSQSLVGSLKWEVPKGWAVRPKTLPVQIAASQTHTASFSISGVGPLYPVPTLSVEYPYTGDRRFTVTKPLSIVRSVHAPKASTPPVIDGMIREPHWLDSVSEFYGPDGSPVVTEPVEFYFTWDDSNLYVAAECKESDLGSMAAAVKDRDGPVYGEDCVGFFFQPQIADGPVYQIYFNPVGTAFDQKIEVADGRATGADAEWDGTYEVKTFNGVGFWSIEIRIPLDQFDTVGSYEQTWALNFRRKQKRLNSSADWQVPIGYDPKAYGILVMK